METRKKLKWSSKPIDQGTKNRETSVDWVGTPPGYLALLSHLKDLAWGHPGMLSDISVSLHPASIRSFYHQRA